MSARCWLTSLSLLFLTVACGGGSGNNDGGGGGNTPSLSISPTSSTVIAGGAPVKFTANLANATGTVSWALTGPGSIDPASGNSTSYTPPASVTSATTATLTATSGTLTASATITVNPPPTIITVAGKVADAAKKGVSGATVAIGSQHTTTDGTGAFSIPGVTAPYDAVVIVPVGRNFALVFKGLTRADPTLFASPFPEALPNIGTVSGTVSGGDPLPAASDITAVAWGSPETAASSPPFATNPWTIIFEWGGPAVTTGNVHALQWTPTTGIPTAYMGHGVATGVAVANGGTTNSVAISMTAPVASTISGTVTVPAGVTLTRKTLDIAFADGAAFTVGTDSTASTSFNYPVPTGIGSTASVTAVGGMATGEAAGTRVSGIAAGSTGTAINVLAPAVQSTPVANATGVSTSTDFTWTQLAGGLHIVFINSSASATAPAYFLITTGTTGRIPDLGSLGVVLPASTAYSWTVQAIGPWASVDEFAGGVGLLPTGSTTLNSSGTGARNFTTQ